VRAAEAFTCTGALFSFGTVANFQTALQVFRKFSLFCFELIYSMFWLISEPNLIKEVVRDTVTDAGAAIN
jgi:hypothetical protein